MFSPLVFHIQTDDKGTIHFYPYQKLGNKYLLPKKKHDKIKRIWGLKIFVEFLALTLLLSTYRHIGNHLGIEPSLILIPYIAVFGLIEYLFMKHLTRNLKPSTRPYVPMSFKERWNLQPTYARVFAYVALGLFAVLLIIMFLGANGYTIKDLF